MSWTVRWWRLRVTRALTNNSRVFRVFLANRGSHLVGGSNLKSWYPRIQAKCPLWSSLWSQEPKTTTPKSKYHLLSLTDSTTTITHRSYSLRMRWMLWIRKVLMNTKTMMILASTCMWLMKRTLSQAARNWPNSITSRQEPSNWTPRTKWSTESDTASFSKRLTSPTSLKIW